MNWATSFVGKPGIGDGQCTRLIEGALGVTGCKPGKGYVWGRALKDGEPMMGSAAVAGMARHSRPP